MIFSFLSQPLYFELDFLCACVPLLKQHWGVGGIQYMHAQLNIVFE